MFGRAATWASWVAAFCVACGAAERKPPEGEGGTSNAGGVLAGGTTGGVTNAGGTPGSGGANARGGVEGGGAVGTGGVSTGAGPTGSGGVAMGGAPAGSGGVATAGKAAGGATSGGAQAGGSAAGGFSAGAAGEAGAPGLCDDYVACGCGCCSTSTGPAAVGRCYYPEAGESLSDIIEADQTAAANPNCASAGCSSGLRYACCLRGGPEPAGGATYSTSYASTALDRLTILKTGTDGRCARMVFVFPQTGTTHTALELPKVNGTLSWGLESAHEMACSMSALPPSAIGATGSLRLRSADAGCVADVHITAFFARNGGVEPVYFDADGLTLEGMSPTQCQ